MTKMIALVLCFVLALSIVGCGSVPTPESGDKSKPVVGEADMPNNSESVDMGEKQNATIENNDSFKEVDTLKEPPELIVLFGEKDSIKAWKGTYSWIYQNDDGTGMGITADSVHPLEAKEILPYFVNLNPSTANLQWDIAPDKVSVCCWNEEDWGQPDAKSEELEVLTLMVDSNVEIAPITTIKLKGGNYIYEVVAEWNSSEKYNGTVCYSFYTVQ